MLSLTTEPTSLEQSANFESWWRPLTLTESRKKPANITQLTGSLTLRVPPILVVYLKHWSRVRRRQSKLSLETQMLLTKSFTQQSVVRNDCWIPHQLLMSAQIPMTLRRSLHAIFLLERLEDRLPQRHLTTNKPTTLGNGGTACSSF